MYLVSAHCTCVGVWVCVCVCVCGWVGVGVGVCVQCVCVTEALERYVLCFFVLKLFPSLSLT